MGRRNVIVIGGGIIGATIAWYLARAGAGVTVVAEKPGGVATPNSFAWINSSYFTDETYFRLRSFSMAEWKRLGEACPGLPLSWAGSLTYDLSPEEMADFQQKHGRWGYDIRPLSRAEAAEIEPALAIMPETVLHVRSEGTVEPEAAARHLLAEAERLGARIMSGTRVAAIATRSGHVSGVETSDGPVEGDDIVLAAGAASKALASQLGVDIPVAPSPGLLIHSKPYRKTLNGVVISPELDLRQTQSGQIVASTSFGGSDPGENPADTAGAIFGKVKEHLHSAGDLELERYTIGYRPMPADGLPIVGPTPDLPGLYLAVMHSGVTLAPAIGHFAAKEILQGECAELLEPYRLSRFAAA